MGRGALAGMLLDGQVTLILMGASAGGGSLGAFLIAGFLALGIAFLPIAALIGAIYGGCAAPSAKEVNEGLSALGQAVTDSEISRRLARTIFDAAVSCTDASITLGGPGSPLPPCESILEVQPATLALAGPYNVNPPLRLTVAVTVRMVRVADGAVLHEMTLVRSRPLEAEFLRWASEGGRLLRAELDTLPGDLAGRFVEEMFLLHLLPLDRVCRKAP
jgi:hypothetical protein